MTSKTILVLDDNTMVCKLIRMTLEELDFNVVTFVELKLALERIWSGGVDLVLLDINMPDVSGLSVCKSLKEDDRTKDLPVIFLSSIDEEKLARHAEASGAQGYINKNKGFKELSGSIKSAVESAFRSGENGDV